MRYWLNNFSAMFGYKIIIVLMFLLIQSLHSQEACRTPNQRDGVCVRHVDCPSFEEYFASGRILNEQEVNFLHLSICSMGPTKICCPDRHLRNDTSTGSTITTITTPRPVTGSVSSVNLLPDPSKYECGFDSLTHRILSGMDASLGDFPWYALLEYKTDNGSTLFKCGGSLINGRYVLTGAHCLSNPEINRKVFTLVNIRLGEHDTTSEEDCEVEGDERVCSDPPQNIGIEDTIIHPDYSQTDRNQHHDIALIRLKKEVEMSEYVNPICLPDSKFNATMPGVNVTVAGFGHTGSRSHSGVKQKVQLPVVDQTQCRNKWSKRSQLQDGQLCAGGIFNVDTCFGDSGGPLMTQNLYWTLEGIVSFGNKCGLEGWPGVYTKVSSYVEWIRSMVKP